MSTERTADRPASALQPPDAEWQRVSPILDALHELPLAERAEFLDRACGDDAALRATVMRYAAAYERVEANQAFMTPPHGGLSEALEAMSARVATLRASQLNDLRAALAERYSIEREIARGGMATVFLGHDRRLDRPVAVKLLDPVVAAIIGRERFQAEVRITAMLQHPLILPLFDSGDANGMLWYTMPYIQGPSLRERMVRVGRLAIAEVLAIARDVASALAYAHAQDIIHRDVTPANILLGERYAMLGDFGVARALHRVPKDIRTASGIAVGTLAYMSPEQRAGSRDVDDRSDVFALGCVLHHMIAGEAPRRDLDGNVQIDPAVQHALGDRITRTLSPSAAMRPSASELLELLETRLSAGRI